MGAITSAGISELTRGFTSWSGADLNQAARVGPEGRLGGGVCRRRRRRKHADRPAGLDRVLPCADGRDGTVCGGRVVVLRWLGRGACGVLWSGADLNRRPPLFQSGALPTELPDLCSNARTVARASRWAGATGFEPATSGLTGRRELQTSPRPQICAPRGIRIPVAALKGQSPRPLDDGGREREFT